MLKWLFLALFFAGSMAIWHGVDYLTREVLTADDFYQKWPKVNNQKSFFLSFLLFLVLLFLVFKRKYKNRLWLVLHDLLDWHWICLGLICANVGSLSINEGKIIRRLVLRRSRHGGIWKSLS